MPKITPYLWFNENAEEAINYYLSIFKNSKLIQASRRPEGAPGKAGALLAATFELDGQQFIALNGGLQFKFTEAISFLVSCKDQAEVDYYWDKLTAEGGEEQPCGWLKDKFGLSWQIVPVQLPQMLGDQDPARASRSMQAMLKMKKIVIADLQAAYDNK